MHKLRMPGFFILTLIIAVAVGISSTGGSDLSNSNNHALTGTDWILVALDGQPVTPGSAITLQFEADGTLRGFDGCNRYWGSFSVDGYTLKVADKMASTQSACAEPLSIRTIAYKKSLMHTVSFNTDGNRLSLLDDAGYEVALFKVNSQTLAGTSWKVIGYNNGKQAVDSVLNGTHITVSFGDDGQLTGSAGCNQYFTEYQGADGAITIGLPGVTRRFCTDPMGLMDQEARYLEAVRSAATFRLEGDRLALRTTDGSLAVTLVRDSDVRQGAGSAAESKIHFDLTRLNPDGLQGPPDGLRALDYEYCIPDRPDAISEVTAADPSLQIQKGSPGRIGCGHDQLLCLGNTHQNNYRYVLERLSELPYVVEIREAFFE